MYNGFIVTDSIRNTKQYDGATLKFGITEGGVDYIVKSPKGGISSTYSEYVASRFILALGVPCHEVWLGYYNNTLVAILKDFTTKDIRLRSYKDTRQSSEDTDTSNKSYTYSDVLYMIEKHTKLDRRLKELMIHRFWSMFICDAILGNRDRHAGNWGYLAPKTGTYTPAPIYDNGGSLFPGVDRMILQMQRNEYKFIADRSERFPASVFKIARANGEIKKTNYYDILSDLRINKVLALEIKQLKTNIGFMGIMQTIINVLTEAQQFISPIYMSFYALIVGTRYLHLIERLSIQESYERTRCILDGR